MNNPQDGWLKCQAFIKQHVTEQQYNTWFKPITFESYDNSKHELVLHAPNDYFCQYIEENFIKLVAHALHHIFGPKIQLRYRYPVGQEDKNTRIQEGQEANDAKMQGDKQGQESNDLDSQLDPRMSFRNFIKGSSNKMALAIATYAADHPNSTKFNPMFLYGPCGCGKTHLVNAIGLKVKEQFPKKRVLYVSARTFQTQFITATQVKDRLNDFIAFYQTIDVLIVDDVQEWINSPKTQDTFFHIFDYLFRHGKRIVLVSDREPVQLRGMNERLITRFICGVTTDIEHPDIQLCIDILNSIIRCNGLTISPDVVRYIAETANGSIRDLQGIINSLLAYSIVYNSEIDIPLAEQMIRRSIRVDHEPVTINRITDAVCGHYNVSIDDVNGKKRKQEIVLARQVSMYLAQKHTQMSATSIGRFIGGRDHSTVLHSCNRIQKMIDDNKAFKAEIESLSKEIE